MRFDTKISCRDLSHYTIYFLILYGREAELFGGRKLFLSEPEDENFTAKAWHERVSFEDIKYIYYNLPVLEDNGEIYDTLTWWDLLSKSEKGNVKSTYASGLTESGGIEAELTIRYIYRELLLDQFIKGIVQLSKYEKYLNWWKLLPWKDRNKILYDNLKPKHSTTYTLDDIIILHDLSSREIDNISISVLHWWFELDDNVKLNLIHEHINPHFHITSPSIEQIKMLNRHYTS